jgi:branched-chain amino acid transport system permease protein
MSDSLASSSTTLQPSRLLPRHQRTIAVSIELLVLLVFLALPWCVSDTLGDRVTDLFIFAILALGLNVVVGYTGLLHLGIGAFYGIGAYIAAILTINNNPFQIGFTNSLVIAIAGTAAAGLLLGSPTLRVRGDYLALVTLGFGEVVKRTLLNLEQITEGSRSLNPIPPPTIPQWLSSRWSTIHSDIGINESRRLLIYLAYYYLSLSIVVVVVLLLRNLERSRLGRAWVAIREDELAAKCMAINAPRAKLSAFAISAALAGLAGALAASKVTSTPNIDQFGFSLSISVLCCVILGGLGSIRGVLLGVLLLQGYELILVPYLDLNSQAFKERFLHWLTTNWPNSFAPRGPAVMKIDYVLTFNNWKLMIFGLVLILVVRFRPEGLLPSRRVQHELHGEG